MATIKTPLLADNTNTARDDVAVDVFGSGSDDDDADHNALVPAENRRNALGLINGVIVPCLLNIVGTILFLRLTWAVGEAGLLCVLLMFAIGELQAVLTTLSMSAIVTNGSIAGGGSYYILSRSVGPEIGGGIGVLFYLAYTVSVTFNTTAFAEEMAQTFFQKHAEGYRLLIGSISLAALVVVGLLGAKCFTKVNVPLFVVQFAAIAYGTFCVVFYAFLSKKPRELSHGGTFDGWHARLFANNLLPSYTNGFDFRTVFAIIFPAVTGIMEGANLSGDLKHPSKSIPKGTLWAIGISALSYVLVMFAGAGVERDTLRSNPYLLQDAMVGTQIIAVVGICVATLSSALGAIFGGARILQALARDGIVPRFLGYGSAHGDEPLFAVLLTYAFAQALLFIGGLDVVAPVTSSLFCMSYFFVNASVLLIELSSTPNWRPRFKHFNQWTALGGMLISIGVMFYLSWLYALIASLALVALVVYLNIALPVANYTGWQGDVRQALMFHQARSWLLALDHQRAATGKNWRPSMLLFTPTIDTRLTHLVNYLKKGGVFIVGNVLLAPSFNRQMVEEYETTLRAWEDTIAARRYKAFVKLTLSTNNDKVEGFRSLLMMSGLGVLTPTTMIMAVPMERRDDASAAFRFDAPSTATTTPVTCAKDFRLVISAALQLQKNVVIACNIDKPSSLSPLLSIKELVEPSRNAAPRTIDVWLPQRLPMTTFDDVIGTPLLMLHLAYVLQRKRVTIRVFRVVNDATSQVQRALESERLIELIRREARFRIEEPIIVGVKVDDDDKNATEQDDVRLNQLILEHSTEKTSFCLLPLPAETNINDNNDNDNNEDNDDEDAALHRLAILTHRLPPTLAICAAFGGQQLMSTTI